MNADGYLRLLADHPQYTGPLLVEHVELVPDPEYASGLDRALQMGS